MKRIISTFLVLVITSITVIGITSVSAATTPSFKNIKATNITYKDAKVYADVANGTSVTKVGCRLGITKNKYPINLSDNTKKLNWVESVWYKMSSKKVTLKSNTTYYYQFYAVKSGKTYYSSINHFNTTPDYIYCTNKKATNITYNNATISCYVNNPKKEKITITGFQITADKSFKSNIKSKSYSISNKGSFSRSYDIKKTVGALKENTTYYFRFFNKVGSKNRNSQIVSFKTPIKSNVTQIRFPLDTGKVWYASTYPGHGDALAGAYSAVDITLKNGTSARGNAVYSAEAGNVVAIDESNGQVVLKHTKKLVTTNNKTYSAWYSVYAHMSDITVKVGNSVSRGKQIGKVSDVGKATGPHLHFHITSGNNGSTWYQNTNRKKAISPYYVYGFVNQNGSNTKYCICDRQGPAVTEKLINWKPTGV